jgi:heme exporter protein CcmD
MPTLDKYAPYILSAYGVAIIALAGLIAWTAWRAIEAKKKLDAAEARETQKEPGL